MSNNEMGKQMESEFITLINEDGAEVQAELLDTLEHNGRRYFLIGDITEEDEQDVFIFEVKEDDGKEVLEELLDEELESEIFELFKEKSPYKMWAVEEEE